jgi:glycosyltransferase involved in cell wall biosynthesis
MKIGVMLRALEEKQGIGIYSQNLLDHLLQLDKKNEYVLYYRNPKFLGRYAAQKNVTEKLVVARSKFVWDQIKIPLEAARDNVDVIFHTKFSVPLFTRRKTVMTIHGAGWFVHPELFKRYSVWYNRIVMPIYCSKASAILSNSDLTTRDFVTILGVDGSKIRTVYLAADDRFRPITDQTILVEAKRKYALPDRFILSVIKHDPRKNFKNLIEAFRRCYERVKCKLVVVGIGCEKYREEYKLREIGLDGDITFLGWVEQDELVALYNLADFVLYPSIYETFGIPVCEAMACGCPAVVAKTGSLPEIAGDAAILVDPINPNEIAEALYTLWTDEKVRKFYAEKAYLRSKIFSWTGAARDTLAALESVAGRAGSANMTALAEHQN